MLNEELLDNRDKEILRLSIELKKAKACILEFKKYDKERQQYYKNALIELGQCRSYIEELESGSSLIEEISKLKTKIEKQRTELNRLNNIIAVNRYLESDEEKIDEVINFHTIESLKRRNATLVSECKQLREIRDKYLSMLNRINNENRN